MYLFIYLIYQKEYYNVKAIKCGSVEIVNANTRVYMYVARNGC